MKERSFFSKLFSSVQSPSHRRQACRKLRCEALEDRRLLSADPIRDFDLEDPIIYETDSKIPDSVVCMTSAKIGSGSLDDLIVVESATNSIQVLEFKATSNNFETLYKKTQIADTLDPNNMAFTFTDVNNDNYQDFVIVQADTGTRKLEITVYKGVSDGSFTRVTPKQYNIPILNETGYSSYLPVTVRVSGTTDNSIVVQVDAIDTSSSGKDALYNLTYIYKGLSSGDFDNSNGKIVEVTSMMTYARGSSPAKQSAYHMIGTAEISAFDIGNDDFIVYYDGNTSTSNTSLCFTKYDTVTGSWKTFTYNTETHNELSWARSAGDNRLVVGGQHITSLSTSDAMLVFQNFDYTYNSIQGNVVTADVEYKETGSFVIDSATAVVGAFSSNTAVDVVVNSGERNESKFFKSTVSGNVLTYGNMIDLGVSLPGYHSSYWTTIGGKDALVMMGDHYFWYLLSDDNGGFVDNPQMVDLGGSESVKIKKAIFDDFDRDGDIDIAVLGDAGVTNLWLYLQNYNEETGTVSFIRAWTGDPPSNSSDFRFSTVVDIVSGDFCKSAEGDGVDLALLVTNLTESGENQYICVYEGKNGSSWQYAGSYESPVNGATAIYAADLFATDDAGLDEIVLARVVSGAARAEVYTIDSAATSKNKLITNKGFIQLKTGAATGDSIYIDCNDIDKDGRDDIAWLYTPKSGAGGIMGYSLQQDGKTFSQTPTKTQSIATANKYTGLILDYVDDDVYLDLVTTVSTVSGTNTNTGLYIVWGKDGADDGKFDWTTTPHTFTTTTSLAAGYNAPAIAFGHMIGTTKSSNDVAIAFGNTVAIWSNQAQSSGSSGTAYVLCQNYSQAQADTLEDAYETARLWIDEYSWFSLDVWAKTDGAGDLETFSFALDFDSNIFVVNGTPGNGQFASNITSEISDKSGTMKTVTVMGSVSGNHGNNEPILLARVFFKPTPGENYGVPLDSTGKFSTAKQILGTDAFSISTDNILLNGGMPVAEIGQTYNNSESKWDKSLESIEDLYLFPVTFDYNNLGSTGDDAFGYFISCFGKKISEIPESWPKEYYLFDVAGGPDGEADGTISDTDFQYFTSIFGKSKNDFGITGSKYNSLYDNAGIMPMALYYQAYPQTSAIVSNAVVDDALLAVADEIVDEVLLPEVAAQTTGSTNATDNVLVELAGACSPAVTIDENDSADDSTAESEGASQSLAVRAVEQVADKKEVDVLVVEAKSDLFKRGINLSLETTLETELV